MYYYNNIIDQNGLQPADRIVAPKSGWEIIQHHAIYWGRDANGADWVIENVVGLGVKYTEFNEFYQRVGKITRIEKFSGNYWERQDAIQRGVKYIGQPYNVVSFNCEHFANLVQTKEVKSQQMNKVGVGLWLAFAAALVYLGTKES
jgi:hypothetical protein